MKKILACCLAAAILLSLPGCGSGNALPPGQGPAETPQAQAELPRPDTATVPEPAAPAETEEPVIYDGVLFFTVSEIAFSLRGESEDIYAGTLPREAVTWESGDESVAVFRDGVLTATGVGSTTVSASYLEQRLECPVSCLASTPEELASLDDTVLRSPKRYPPIVDAPEGYFADAALVGDSISYILFQNEAMQGYLNHPLFLVRGGTGIYGVLAHTMDISYQGKETALDDALFRSGVNKAFIMLGQNDLGWRNVEDTLESIRLLVDTIRNKCPELEIYIESVIPEWTETTRNDKIYQYDELLRAYTEEAGCHYLDILTYVEDHTGRMATVYSLDEGIHLNADGCLAWAQALNAYACLETLEESGQ